MIRLAPTSVRFHHAHRPPPSPPQEPPCQCDEAKTEAHKEAAPAHTTLTVEDLRLIDRLEVRDREVRAHEQAHKMAAGAHAGPIHYEYQLGPDKKRYAVGGHVEVDLSPIPGNPKATIQKMQQLYRAALAPRDPSAADMSAARRAKTQEAQARAELIEQKSSDEGASGLDIVV